MTINWISEAERLPIVGEKVLLATPRQSGEFWDLSIGRLLTRHEGVVPAPVPAGSQWPTNYYWGRDHWGKDNLLMTGNTYWARLDGIPLPPGAEHRRGPIRGEHYVAQIGDCFIPQGRSEREA